MGEWNIECSKKQYASQSGEVGIVTTLGSQQASERVVNKRYGMPTMNSPVQSQSAESRPPTNGSGISTSPVFGRPGRAPCLPLK